MKPIHRYNVSLSPFGWGIISLAKQITDPKRRKGSTGKSLAMHKNCMCDYFRPKLCCNKKPYATNCCFIV